jgi:hypothetical protein
VGILSQEDTEAIEKAIEESCEQINPGDWKIPYTRFNPDFAVG